MPERIGTPSTDSTRGFHPVESLPITGNPGQNPLVAGRNCQRLAVVLLTILCISIAASQRAHCQAPVSTPVAAPTQLQAPSQAGTPVTAEGSDLSSSESVSDTAIGRIEATVGSHTDILNRINNGIENERTDSQQWRSRIDGGLWIGGTVVGLAIAIFFFLRPKWVHLKEENAEFRGKDERRKGKADTILEWFEVELKEPILGGFERIQKDIRQIGEIQSILASLIQSVVGSGGRRSATGTPESQAVDHQPERAPQGVEFGGFPSDSTTRVVVDEMAEIALAHIGRDNEYQGQRSDE